MSKDSKLQRATYTPPRMYTFTPVASEKSIKRYGRLCFLQMVYKQAAATCKQMRYPDQAPPTSIKTNQEKVMSKCTVLPQDFASLLCAVCLRRHGCSCNLRSGHEHLYCEREHRHRASAHQGDANNDQGHIQQAFYH